MCHHGNAGGLLFEKCDPTVLSLRPAGADQLRRGGAAAHLEAEYPAVHRRRHGMLHAAGTAGILKKKLADNCRLISFFS